MAMASTFGANLGDFLAWQLKLGHWPAALVAAAAFVAVLTVERFLRCGSIPLYWIAVILVRACATDIADGSSSLHLTFSSAIPLGIVILAAAVGLCRRWIVKDTENTGLRVNAAYWLLMLLAGIPGTLLADCLAYAAMLLALKSTLFYAALLVMLFAIGGIKRFVEPVFFWSAMVFVGSFGSNFDDFVGQGIGQAGSLLVITGFLLSLLIFYRAEIGAAKPQ